MQTEKEHANKTLNVKFVTYPHLTLTVNTVCIQEKQLEGTCFGITEQDTVYYCARLLLTACEVI